MSGTAYICTSVLWRLSGLGESLTYTSHSRRSTIDGYTTEHIIHCTTSTMHVVGYWYIEHIVYVANTQANVAVLMWTAVLPQPYLPYLLYTDDVDSVKSSCPFLYGLFVPKSFNWSVIITLELFSPQSSWRKEIVSILDE